MDELTTRTYRDDDAAAFAALSNAIEAHAGGHPGYTEEETRALVAAMVADVGTDTRLIHAADGTLVAAALVPTPPPGGHQLDIIGGVAPGWRGRGIGRDLLAWQIERAGQIRDAVAPDAPWEVHAGAALDDTDAIRLYTRLGLAPIRYFFEMVAPTATVPAVPVPAGLRLTPYTPELEKALYETHMEAFSDHWGFQRREYESWTTMTVRSDGFLPELSRLAYDGDELVGYVLTYADAAPTRLYLGQVGTRRPWRRRGLAAAMLADVLAAGAHTGRTQVGLGVDADSPTGAVSVYERVGFAVETRGVAYAKPVR